MEETRIDPDILPLRQEMDQLNQQLAELFIQRLEVARSISLIKKEKNLPLHDLEREQLMFEISLENYESLPEKKWVRNFLTQVFSISLEYLRGKN